MTSAQCDNTADESAENYFKYDAGSTPIDLVVDVVVDPLNPWNAVVSSRTDCNNIDTENACTRGEGSEHLEVLGVTGVVYLIVDGTGVFGGITSGSFTIAAHTRPILAAGDSCDSTGVQNRCGGDTFCQGGKCVATSRTAECTAAVDLTSALAATGSTTVTGTILAFEPGYYQGSCGFDTFHADPERLYRLTVSTPSMLEASTDDVNGTDFDTDVYIVQGTCDGTELACNDDANGSGDYRSDVATMVQPGVYYIVVDTSSPVSYGVFSSEQRHYKLTVTLSQPNSDAGTDM